MKRDYDCRRASVSSVARPSAIWCADTAKAPNSSDALRRQLPQPYSAVLFQQRSAQGIPRRRDIDLDDAQ
jgi:hypothetical protein